MQTNGCYGSDGSNSSKGVTSLQPQLPFLVRLAAGDVTLTKGSLDWLVPLGMKHLQDVWDDERTHAHILESVETYITSITTSTGANDGTSTFNPTPLQLLLVLDVVRRWVNEWMAPDDIHVHMTTSMYCLCVSNLLFSSMNQSFSVVDTISSLCVVLLLCRAREDIEKDEFFRSVSTMFVLFPLCCCCCYVFHCSYII